MVTLRTLSFQGFKVIKQRLSKCIFFSITSRELFTCSSCTCTYCFVKLQELEENTEFHFLAALPAISHEVLSNLYRSSQIKFILSPPLKEKQMKGSPRSLCKFASRTSKSSNSPISFLLRPGFFFSMVILPFKRFRFRLKTKC